MAIRAALLQRVPEARTELIEALDFAPKWFTKAYRDGYLRAIAKTPRVAGWLYQASDKPQGKSGMGDAVERAGLRKFVALPSVQNADVIVTTHFLCGRVLSAAKRRGKLRTPLVVGVTDQHPHGVWLVPHADRILVASDQARDAAVRHGILPERVRVTGVPIDTVFASPTDQASVRAKHGLPAGKAVVLIAGGGLGLGGMEQAVHGAINEAQTHSDNVHLVVVCGSNTELKARLDALAGRQSGRGVTCSILGFTHDMADLMSVASVMVGKPGGLTTAEACAKGLAMVLLKPIPGQEERNAHRLVSAGAAVLEPDGLKAGALAVAIVREHGGQEKMRQASRALGVPGSAMNAVAQVLSLLGAQTAET